MYTRTAHFTLLCAALAVSPLACKALQDSLNQKGGNDSGDGTGADPNVATTKSINDGPLKGAKVTAAAGVLPVGTVLQIKETTQPEAFANVVDANNAVASASLALILVDVQGAPVTLTQPLLVTLPYATETPGALTEALIQDPNKGLVALLQSDSGSLYYWAQGSFARLDTDAQQVTLALKVGGVLQLAYVDGAPEGFASAIEAGVGVDIKLGEDRATTNPSCDYRQSPSPKAGVSLGTCLEYTDPSEIESRLELAKSYCEVQSAEAPAGLWHANSGCALQDVIATCAYVVANTHFTAFYYGGAGYYTTELAARGCDLLHGDYGQTGDANATHTSTGGSTPTTGDINTTGGGNSGDAGGSGTNTGTAPQSHLSCELPQSHICSLFVGSSYGASTNALSSACQSNGGTIGNGCPTTEIVGYCKSNVGTTVETWLYSYSPTTAQDARGSCADTWVPAP